MYKKAQEGNRIKFQISPSNFRVALGNFFDKKAENTTNLTIEKYTVTI